MNFFKKTYVLIVTLLILMIGCVNDSSKLVGRSTPVYFQNLNEVIKESFEIEDRLDGHLNNDQYIDELYVIRYNSTGRRCLVICMGVNEDFKELYLISSSAIQQNGEDSIESDPYIGIKIINKGFQITHKGIRCSSCELTYTFSFNENDRTFYLINSQALNMEIDSLQSVKKSYNRTQQEAVNLYDFDIRTEY